MRRYHALFWLLCVVASSSKCPDCTTIIVSTTKLAGTEPSAIANLSSSSTIRPRPSNTFLPYSRTAISLPSDPSTTPAYHKALRRRRRRAACTRADIVQECGRSPAPSNSSNSTSACGGTPSTTGSTRATINAASYEFCKAKFSGGKLGRVLEYGEPSLARTVEASDGNTITFQALFDWSQTSPDTSITMDVQGCYMGFVSAVSICGANSTETLVLGGHFETNWNGVQTFFYIVIKPAAVIATVATVHGDGNPGNVIAGATGATAGVVLVIVTALFLYRRKEQGKPVCGASKSTYMTPRRRTQSPYPSPEKFGHASKKSMQSTSTKRSGPYPAVAWLYDAFPKPPPIRLPSERFSSATTLQASAAYPGGCSATLLNSDVSSHGRVRSSPMLSPTNTGGFKHGHISWQQQSLNRRSAPLLLQTPATPPSPTISSHRRVQSANQAPSQWPVVAHLFHPERPLPKRKVRPASHILSPFNSAGIRTHHHEATPFRKGHRRQQSSFAYSCSIYSRGSCDTESRRPTVDQSEAVPELPAVHLNNEKTLMEEEKRLSLRKGNSAPETSLRRSFFGSKKKKRLGLPMLARQMSAYYAASLESLSRNFASSMGGGPATASAPDLLGRNEFEGWPEPTMATLIATITGPSQENLSIHPALRTESREKVPGFAEWKAGLPKEPIPAVTVGTKESPVDDYHHFLT